MSINKLTPKTEVYVDDDGIIVLKTGIVHDHIWYEEMDVMLFVISGNKYEFLRNNYTGYD